MLSLLVISKMTYTIIVLGLCVISYLTLNKRQRHAVRRRLRLYSRRPSSADTPPRSLTPEQKPKSSIIPKTNDYANIFPPSQRHTLPQILKTSPLCVRQAVDDLSFDNSVFEHSLLDYEENYGSANDSKYLYSGFSIKEVKALGDFPDYSTLCEVPLPQPNLAFDIHKALPRPYRPFRWAYYQTMSLAKMDIDYWLELEKTYVDRIAERKALYAEHGKAVLDYLPGTELACKELMEMALQFLCARYPHYFSLYPDANDNTKTIFENKILRTTQIVQEKHPLLVLLDNVPEDFAVMHRKPDDGFYVFRAGVICSALGWSLGSKFNQRLHEIHEPIPDYKEKMQFSMDRYFSKKPVNKPIQRTSWGLEVDQPLFMPPGHPHEKYRDEQSSDVTLERIHLRTDHQTLRRLPLSGAIVFNFKALFTPITEFRDEPGLPSLVLKVCREGKESLMKYKNTWHVEHVTLPAMEEYEREQKEKGLIPEDWKVQTLDEHPFFPGWEEKWHGQQGF